MITGGTHSSKLIKKDKSWDFENELYESNRKKATENEIDDIINKFDKGNKSYINNLIFIFLK